MLKRLTALLLCLLALSAGPAALATDTAAEREIRIQYCYHDTLPLAGATLRLYEVGQLNSEGKPVLNRSFASFRTALSLDERSRWPELAEELAAFVEAGTPAPAQTTRAGADGSARFPVAGATLRDGLYLIVAAPHVQDGYVYSGRALLLELPYYDKESGASYTKLNAQPKIDRSVFEGVFCSVIVVWIDEGYEQYRPATVNVDLLCDSAIVDSATVGAKQNWRHTFTGLHRETELAAPAPRYQLTALSSRQTAEPVYLEGWIDQEPTRVWTVKQNAVERYTTSYDRVDDTFIITNRIKLTPSPSPSPTASPKPSQKPDQKPEQIWQTGQLWWPVPLLCLAALAALLVGLRRGRAKR